MSRRLDEVDAWSSVTRRELRRESGPVDQRVWDALRDLFVTNVRAIVRPVTTRTGDSAMAYYRRGRPAPSLDTHSATLRPALSAAAPSRDAPDRDELDRLFLGDD